MTINDLLETSAKGAKSLIKKTKKIATGKKSSSSSTSGGKNSMKSKKGAGTSSAFSALDSLASETQFGKDANADTALRRKT